MNSVSHAVIFVIWIWLIDPPIIQLKDISITKLILVSWLFIVPYIWGRCWCIRRNTAEGLENIQIAVRHIW